MKMSVTRGPLTNRLMVAHLGKVLVVHAIEQHSLEKHGQNPHACVHF